MLCSSTSAALESLNAEQVKKIHPSVDSEALKRAFKEMRELKVTIDSIKVLSSDGATARVTAGSRRPSRHEPVRNRTTRSPA